MAAFLRDRGLPSATAEATNFFDLLLEAAVNGDAAALAWCNDTRYAVMAALGVEESGGIVTRGWYRVHPGRCLRADAGGRARRLFSFAEAIDEDGHVIRRDDKPLAWGGPVVLCTRQLQFEISEHENCGERGLLATGFIAVETKDRRSATVRFRD